eukprot:XP_001690455.1 predicted protein [Chlamydomonas reinhardtii]
MPGLGALWDSLVDCICRPPRDEYVYPDELVGGRRGLFRVGRYSGVREDLTLVNKRGMRLQCSHYFPKHVRGRDGRLPCVIYCHCNSGSRRDAEEAICVLIPRGVSVFALDFAGSGLSEGQWVTLGAEEVDDVEAAVEHLRGSGRVSTLGLWGRSMGAVTALLYAQRDPSIAGMVLDSPFSRLTDLMMEIVAEQRLPIPRPLAKLALAAMKRSVSKRASFDINKVSPVDAVSQSFIPALFGHAVGDTFIKISHAEILHSAYAGDKNLIRFDGDHNSRRPEFFYNSGGLGGAATDDDAEDVSALGAAARSAPWEPRMWEWDLDRSGGLGYDLGLFASSEEEEEDAQLAAALQLSLMEAAGMKVGDGSPGTATSPRQTPAQGQVAAAGMGVAAAAAGAPSGGGGGAELSLLGDLVPSRSLSHEDARPPARLQPLPVGTLSGPQCEDTGSLAAARLARPDLDPLLSAPAPGSVPAPGATAASRSPAPSGSALAAAWGPQGMPPPMGTTAGGPFPAGVGAAPATRARPQAAAPAAASRGGRQAVPGPSLYELYSEEELLALAVQLSLQDANGGAPVLAPLHTVVVGCMCE